MKLKLAGYDFAPQEQFHQDVMSYGQAQTAPWAGGDVALPPQPAQPIYVDDAGNHFAGLPTDDGVAALPYIPGSPAKQNSSGAIDKLGGFVAADQMPSGGGGGDPLSDMLGGVIQEMPSDAVGAWLGGAAGNSALSGSAGQAAAQAMQTLGIPNPLTAGPLGAAMQAAAGAAGIGPTAGLLSGLMSGGQGLSGAMSSAALSGLLGNSGLGSIPGAGKAASMLGGQLGKQMGDLLSGEFPGSLDDASGMINNIVAGDLPGVNDLPDMGSFDPRALGAETVSGAADQLLSQWQVDDESSAAETIANDLVKDNQAQITGALEDVLKEPGGVDKVVNDIKAKIKSTFSGADEGSGEWAVRMGDLDDSADMSVVGVANILFEGKPISRITDLVAGPKAPAPGVPIVEGSSLVFSAGMPTAFITCKTAVTTTLVTGASTVLVGVAPGDVAPPPKKDDKDTADNAGPAGPKDAKDTSSASGEGGDDQSDPAESDKGKQEQTPGETGKQEGEKQEQGATGDQQPSEEAAANSPEEEGGMCKMPEEDDSTNAQSLDELINGSEQKNRSEMDRVEINAADLTLGAGLANHTYITVYKDDEMHTYAGRDLRFGEFGGEHLLAIDKDARTSRGDDYDNPANSIQRTEVSPPPNMSQSDWATNVAAAGENALWNSDTRDYGLMGGDGGYNSGNCHVVTRQIIEDAGGSVPAAANPPGANPGLHPPPPVDWNRKACCFAADTLVRAASGLLPICDLQHGDSVTVMDSNGRASTSTVSEVESHYCQTKLIVLLLDGEVSSEEIVVTSRHPFYDGNSWVASHKLKVGDRLFTVDGSYRTIRKISIQKEMPIQVYNVVTSTGTYAVGRSGLIVSGDSLAQEARRRNRSVGLGVE